MSGHMQIFIVKEGQIQKISCKLFFLIRYKILPKRISSWKKAYDHMYSDGSVTGSGDAEMTAA